jgi:hypothetical protein
MTTFFAALDPPAEPPWLLAAFFTTTVRGLAALGPVLAVLVCGELAPVGAVFCAAASDGLGVQATAATAINDAMSSFMKTPCWDMA